MTFVYRQLLGLPKEWRSCVITRERRNEQLFPYGPVHCIGKNVPERLVNKLCRVLDARYIFLTPPIAARFRGALRQESPDLIHAHFGPCALEILPLAKSLGIPMITTFHGFDAAQLLAHKCYRDQLKELFAYSHVLAVSNFMRDTLLALGAAPHRTRCHYIGAPVEQFTDVKRRAICEKSRSGEEVTFLQISNFVEKKGHFYTLSAFAKFLKKYPNARLLLAGDGELRLEAERLAEVLGLRASVSFLGHKDMSGVIDLMQRADCFVHHSVTAASGDKEGIPTVLMEAMASGLPVISTYHSGIPELIQSGVNGLLVAERDIDGYAVALERILVDDGLIGQNARRTVVQSFNFALQMRELVGIYQDVLNEERTHC